MLKIVFFAFVFYHKIKHFSYFIGTLRMNILAKTANEIFNTFLFARLDFQAMVCRTAVGMSGPYLTAFFFLFTCINISYKTLKNIAGCLFISSGNPLLLNSSMQPDITVGQTYSSPICFQDSIDKELFDPLPDKVKVQSSFMVSLGVADRAEYHVKAHPQTLPANLHPNYSMVEGKKTATMAPNGLHTPGKIQLKTSAVFGHLGGRLVIPNAGETKYRFVIDSAYFIFLWNNNHDGK